MLNRVACDVCEGTGRTSPDGERTMVCHHGCDNGFFDANARDLNGKRAQHGWVIGYLFVWHGSLCLENEDGHVVVNLDPLTVEILP